MLLMTCGERIMTPAVDTNVLLDILIPNSAHTQSSLNGKNTLIEKRQGSPEALPIFLGIRLLRVQYVFQF